MYCTYSNVFVLHYTAAVLYLLRQRIVALAPFLILAREAALTMPKRKKPIRDVMGWWLPLNSRDVQGQTLPSKWSPEAYAQWLFAFLRTDLGALTPGQLLGMRADVWAFTNPEILEPPPSWGSKSLPTAEFLAALQEDARAGIQRVRDGDWFELEKGIRYGIARMEDRVVRGSRRGTFEDLFRAAVMDTVQAFWQQLYECPRCHGVFLKIGKQRYCSLTCGRRTHWDAFKARRSPRDHHGEYERRVKRRLGAKVAVSVKPRRKK